MRQLAFIIFSIFYTHVSFGQSVSEALNSYMSEVREGSYDPVPNSILNTDDESTLFSGLAIYSIDTLPEIRSKANYIATTVGQRSEKSKTKKLAVDQLTQAMEDEDSGIGGKAIDALSGFEKADFSKKYRQQIGALLTPTSRNLVDLLKLAGYLELLEFKNQMNQILDAELTFKVKWTVRLALARMGDPSAIDYLLTRLERAPLDDDFVYDVVPDLIYTRQEAIFEYIEGIVQSDEKNCMPSDPDSDLKILCGYRVIEYLAPTIEDYPLPMDEFGDLDIDDYEAGLIEVRAWLDQNSTYTILKDSY
ncbi:MAG: hypothetical protein OCD76_23440 [Reichenbachiella sp.]